MKYDYEKAVKEDVIDYINDNIDFTEFETLDELEEHLNDVLWVDDSVTGNASGSYTFNAYEAEENLCHNLDLLKEAYSEFGADANALLDCGAESADVTIRCYLLSGAIADALKEIESDFEAAHEKEDDEGERKAI